MSVLYERATGYAAMTCLGALGAAFYYGSAWVGFVAVAVAGAVALLLAYLLPRVPFPSIRHDHFLRNLLAHRRELIAVYQMSVFSLAIQALFASQGSVIHAVPIWSPPEWHYLAFVVDLYRLEISSEGQRRLVEFIEQSLESTESGSAIEIQPGWAPGSHFYRARGRYSAFHTCNQWTADAIRRTGFPITAAYASTAGNVGWQVHAFSRKYQGDVMLLRNGKPIKPMIVPTTSPD